MSAHGVSAKLSRGVVTCEEELLCERVVEDLVKELT